MPKLLRIDASSRLNDSHSRNLADRLVKRWALAHPQGEIVLRDLVREPIPHISDETIGAFYTPKTDHTENQRQATALSDTLIAEIQSADLIVLDTPMYNFSLPSALKAWIDQIVRIGETFSFSPDKGFAGLLQDKPVFVITATGAAFSNEALKPMDFLTPYLTTLLSFLGLSNIQVLTLEGTTIDETAFQQSQEAAEKAIDQLWSAA